MCFNSLQTGRHIQTSSLKTGGVLGEKVSIPFKREGTFRRCKCIIKTLRMEFQFPSNGKAHSDGETVIFNDQSKCFNSLQTGRHIQTITMFKYTHARYPFQFPSNGKAHSDAYDPSNAGHVVRCFNSLQTGRHIQTFKVGHTIEYIVGFQFPSNGKAHSDSKRKIR